MNIIAQRCFEGPNLYSYCPATLVQVDIGVLEGYPSDKLNGFTERLLEALPGLYEHHCSRGRPGGFAERLYEGTYMGHVIEHVAIELQCLAGMAVSFGKTETTGKPGIYNVVFQHKIGCAGEKAGRHAVRLVEDLLARRRVFVDDIIDDLRKTGDRHGFGPSTEALVEAARVRHIPVMRLGGNSLLQLGWGKNQKRIQATITGNTSCISVDIACNKWLTKTLLEDVAIPVPEGEVVSSEEEAVRAAARIGLPVVVKPYNGNQGKGISLYLTDEMEIRTACRLARNFSEEVIVERTISGRDYRVLVVNGRAVAACERIPAGVTGDGNHTIRQLIMKVNQDPRRGDHHEKPLTKIKVDPGVIMVLAKQGLTLDSIPAAGKTVRLRQNGNLSTGGTAIDVTSRLHPRNADLAVRAVETVGLDVGGVDIVCSDIGVPLDESGGAVIEVNAAPGIRMHHYPSEGQSRDVAGLIINMLFPVGKDGRIPLITVTGSNGKTTTARMIAHILGLSGKRIGLTTTDGISIGGKRIITGDTTGPWSSRVILRDPTVEIGVLELARGGILRSGLAYDESDIGVVTNVSNDHIGQDGVDTLEKLASVKSLVVECVKKEGYVVLNADDPLVAGMRERAGAEPIFFSRRSDNVVIRQTLHEGKSALFVRDGKIIVARGGKDEYSLIDIKSIPATVGGKVEHNIENALAAAGAVLAFGLPAEMIRQGLSTFSCSQEQNPGRFNIVTCGNENARFRVVVDYAHNPPGLRCALQAIRNLMEPGEELISVIASPGDRANENVVKMGATAARYCDRVIIKEDEDTRGRKTGEVAELLLKGCLSNGMEADNVQVVLPEDEAVQRAFAAAGEKTVVAVFYENLDKVMRIVNEYSPSGDGIHIMCQREVETVDESTTSTAG